MLIGTRGAAILGGSGIYPGAALALDFGAGRYRIGGQSTSDPANLAGWSFTRSGAGYAENNAGVLVPFATGVPRITDKGLLVEEARTNLQTYSNPTSGQWQSSNTGTGVAPVVTYNYALAPDGSMTAARVQLDKGAGSTSSDFSQFFAPNATVVNGTTYATAIYVKTNDGSSKTVSIRDGTTTAVVTVTGSWQRFVNVAAASGTTMAVGVRLRGGAEASSQTADLLVWQAEIQAGAFITSPIPTTSASATRAIDAASITGLSVSAPYSVLLDVGGIYNPSGAVDLAMWNTAADGGLLYYTSPSGRAVVNESSSSTANVGGGGSAPSANSPFKVGGRFALNDVNCSHGGNIGTADTSNTPPTMTSLGIGRALYAFGGAANLYLRKLLVYPRGYTNAELQAWTAP